MDIDTLYTRRRAHLQRLIRERFGGNKTAFARAVERNSPEIYRWLKRPDKAVGWARNMSEISARQIEELLDLEQGYLDQPFHDERPFVTASHEPDAAYFTTMVNSAEADAGKAFFSSGSVHTDIQTIATHGDESECRHYALVEEIANTLRNLSYEQVQTISKLIDVIRCQE